MFGVSATGRAMSFGGIGWGFESLTPIQMQDFDKLSANDSFLKSCNHPFGCIKIARLILSLRENRIIELSFRNER